VRALAIARGTGRSLAVGATVAALSNAASLPAPLDAQTSFHPGQAYVRRVPGYNLWILYRFDAEHVDVLTVRDQPPLPSDA
jgi:hypothetical protein